MRRALLSGSAAARNGPSVQGALEAAIEKLSGEGLRGRCWPHRCRRAFPWPGGAFRSGKDLQAGKGARCPEPLIFGLIRSVVTGTDVADAQFPCPCFRDGSALSFLIWNRRAPPSLERGKVWHVSSLLDAGRWHAAAHLLRGHMMSTTFRPRSASASPSRLGPSGWWSRRASEIIRGFRAVLSASPDPLFRWNAEAGGEGKWTPRDGGFADALAPGTARAAARCRRRMGLFGKVHY